ncbi:MAG: PqqD family protein [Candidatus Wallbacteria bacterium]|nr:PqqD family protein [Candidatus Wallbacteria bacterium]
MTRKINRLTISPDGFIFDSETGNSYTLNSVGLLIVEKLRQGIKKILIISWLVREYEVSRQEAEADLTSFMDDLKRCGFLEDK